MSDELTTTVELPFRIRVRHGVRKTQNWLQLVRFAAVGASGYIVNLAVYAFCIHVLLIDYRISAVIAFVVSVVNNFWLNRHWTFSARGERALQQGTRFFIVSLVAFAFTYALLIGMVDGARIDKLIAQAVAVAAATPMSFIGQKLWSFRS